MIKNSFKCPLNTPVFTNRQVLDQTIPITIVIHEIDDGSWKFFSREEKMKPHNHAVMVSLEEILMIDPSISEIAYLPEGSIATRRFVGDSWKIISSKMQNINNQQNQSKVNS